MPATEDDLLSASAHHLQEALQCAPSSGLDDEMRVMYAFLSGYVACQAVLRRHNAVPVVIEHPNQAIIDRASEFVEISGDDLALGHRLLEWEYFERFVNLAPPPVSVEEAAAWAGRIRAAVKK